MRGDWRWLAPSDSSGAGAAMQVRLGQQYRSILNSRYWWNAKEEACPSIRVKYV